MPKPTVPIRTVRIEDDLYDRAKAKAAREGKTFTTVIRTALERYVEEGEDDGRIQEDDEYHDARSG